MNENKKTNSGNGGTQRRNAMFKAILPIEISIYYHRIRSQTYTHIYSMYSATSSCTIICGWWYYGRRYEDKCNFQIQLYSFRAETKRHATAAVVAAKKQTKTKKTKGKKWVPSRATKLTHSSVLLIHYEMDVYALFTKHLLLLCWERFFLLCCSVVLLSLSLSPFAFIILDTSSMAR